MNDWEYQYLKEYWLILLPFTIALDILQGLWRHLNKTRSSKFQMSRNHIQPTSGVPESIVEAIKIRFAKRLNSKDALLAAVSLPAPAHYRMPPPYRCPVLNQLLLPPLRTFFPLMYSPRTPIRIYVHLHICP